MDEVASATQERKRARGAGPRWNVVSLLLLLLLLGSGLVLVDVYSSGTIVSP